MGTSSIELAKRLQKVAKKQYGCFTAAQALEAGYAYSVHLYHVKNKEWIRVERGLYRLASVPESDETRLMIAQLWPRGKSGPVPCHFTGATAASIREGRPSAKAPILLWVSPSFRYTTQPPKGVQIVTKSSPDCTTRKIKGFSVEVPLEAPAAKIKPPHPAVSYAPSTSRTPRDEDAPAFQQPARMVAAPGGMDMADYYDLLDDQAVRGG